MTAFVEHADANGFNVHVHAIGDAAVRETLDAFAAARAAGSKRLYSIAHLQLDRSRGSAALRGQLDVVASLQLLWAQPDNYSIDAAQTYIGPERQARQYPARSLADAQGVDRRRQRLGRLELQSLRSHGHRHVPPQPRTSRARAAGRERGVDARRMLAAYTRSAARLIGRDARDRLAGAWARRRISSFSDASSAKDTSADEVRRHAARRRYSSAGRSSRGALATNAWFRRGATLSASAVAQRVPREVPREEDDDPARGR